jgi:hypothetical protein
MRGHALYLAVIAILVIVIVYVAAKAVRTSRTLKETERKFGAHHLARSTARPRKGPLRSLSAKELIRPRKLAEYHEEVDHLIRRAFVLGEFGKNTQLRGVCLAALRESTRLLPIVLLEVARSVNRSRLAGVKDETDTENSFVVDPAEAALFIEYLHWAAIAASQDSAGAHELPLVAVAMQNLCRQVDWIQNHCPEFRNADRVGTMLCGRVVQGLEVFWESENKDQADIGAQSPEAAINELYRKTFAFFEIAVVTGWLVAGGNLPEIDEVQRVGRHLGIAFRAAADVGDLRRAENNVANLIGTEATEREMGRNLAACRVALKQHNLWGPVWVEIFQKIVGMAHHRSQSQDPAHPLNAHRPVRPDNVGDGALGAKEGPKAEEGRAEAEEGRVGAEEGPVEAEEGRVEAEGSPKEPTLPASSQPPDHRDLLP